jgi:hypothetical protein
MSLFTVSPIDLPAIPGVHGGTGRQQSTNWVVVPDSVPPPGLLQFTGANADITTMLFQIADKVVPNWFGVAIPTGIQDFTRAHIFFHPLPGQARDAQGHQFYPDSEYFNKGAKWPELFYYMERMGNQMDEAGRSQIVIMPFLTEAAQNTGIFAPNWSDIVTDILTQVRSAMGMDDGSQLQISQIVVSSFSIGILYSSWFRQKAAGLKGVMAEVWDFDGRFSSSPGLSTSLVDTADYHVIKYDQVFSSDHLSFHVPQPRWTNYVSPPQTSFDVHGYIRDFMFYPAASISNVGALIQPPMGTGTTSTVPGTGTTSGGPQTGTGTTSATPGAVTGTTSFPPQPGTATPSVVPAGTGTTSVVPDIGGPMEIPAGTGSTSVAPEVVPQEPVGIPGPVPGQPFFPLTPGEPPVAPEITPFTGFPGIPPESLPPGYYYQPPVPGTGADGGAQMQGGGPVPVGVGAQAEEGCGCAVAIVGMVSTVSTTAITAITAITGIVKVTEQE